MGREIRRVPANWEHPKEYVKDRFGKITQEYINMAQADYEEELERFQAEVQRYNIAYDYWLKGVMVRFDWHTGVLEGMKTIEEYCDEQLVSMKSSITEDGDELLEHKYKNRSLRFEDMYDVPEYPNISLIMPYGEWYQLYQNVGEGTPLSPPFETPEELIEWLVNNDDFWGKRWSREAAERILRGGYAPSMIVANGVVYQPHNMVDLT